MKHLLLLLISGALFCANSRAGVLVSPSLAYSPSGYQDNSTRYSRTIDQSGLSSNYVDGVTDSTDFLNLSPTHANYVSGAAWVAPLSGGAGTAMVSFMFSSAVTINQVIVWNAGTGYAITGFDFYTTTDGNNFTYKDSFSLAADDSAQVCAFSAVEVLGFQFQTTGVYSSRIGIGEVVAVTVPEPAQWNLMILGLSFFALCRLGRSARQ